MTDRLSYDIQCHNPENFTLVKHDGTNDIRQFFTRNQICVLNHPPYLPNLAPCDFFLFPKIKIPQKWYFNDIEIVQKAMTRFLKDILIFWNSSFTFFTHSFYSLLNHCQQCIDSGGDYF